jgi:hypothetical protein
MDKPDGMALVEVAWLEEIAQEMKDAEQAITSATTQLAEIHNTYQSRLLDLLHHGFNAKAEGNKSYSAGLLMGYLIMTGEKTIG